MWSIKKYGNLLFLMLLLLHCLFIYTGQAGPRLVSKLLLVPMLVLYFFAASHFKRGNRVYLLNIIGLFFSFLGDLFLTQQGQLFFLLGMGAFVLTHIFNSIYFFQLQPTWSKPFPPLIFTVLFIGVSFLVVQLIGPGLGSLKVPVLVYMTIIGVMGLLAVSVVTNRMYHFIALRYFIPGAAIFIVSDSILAMNTFYFDQPAIWDIPVMFSYGIAQCLLVNGFVQKTE